MAQGLAKTAARSRRLGILLACAMLLAHASPVFAQGDILVREGSTRLENGVWFLEARIVYRLSEDAREALESGLALDVGLTIELNARRRLLWDPELARLSQRYELQYHALTERYIVRNLNSGEQASYGSLEAALAALGDVRRLPLIDDALLDPDTRYRVSLRAVLDIKQLGGPLALIGFLWDDWRIASEWTRWTLER